MMAKLDRTTSQYKDQTECVGPNKKINCFSGTAASVLKVLHYVFLSLSKNKNEIKKAFPVQTIVIGNGHAVPLFSLYSLLLPYLLVPFFSL